MTRPLELVNTVLLTVIAVLLAMLVLTPPLSSPAAPDAQPLNLPTVDCQVAQLFEEGEQLECIPVRVLDAP